MNMTVTLKELENDVVRTVRTYEYDVPDPFESVEKMLIQCLSEAHLEMEGDRPAFASGLLRFAADVLSHDGTRNILSGIAKRGEDGIYRVEIGTKHG